MRPVLLEEAVTVSVWISFVAPEVMPERLTVCRPAFSLIEMFEFVLRVGGWLTGFTATMNDWLTVLLLVAPLLTVTVIVDVPFPFTAGVKVRVPVVLGLV